jgi:hypothetical protein
MLQTYVVRQRWRAETYTRRVDAHNPDAALAQVRYIWLGVLVSSGMTEEEAAFRYGDEFVLLEVRVE